MAQEYQLKQTSTMLQAELDLMEGAHADGKVLVSKADVDKQTVLPVWTETERLNVIESAEVDNNTLTLTKSDGTTTTFTPQGGSAEGAVKYNEAQNLTDAQKVQARKNQGLYYSEEPVEVLTWDGDTTGKEYYEYGDGYNILYKISDDTSWFDTNNLKNKYTVELAPIPKQEATWDGTGKSPIAAYVKTGSSTYELKNLYKILSIPEDTPEDYWAYMLTKMSVELQNGSTSDIGYVSLYDEVISGKDGTSGEYYISHILSSTGDLNHKDCNIKIVYRSTSNLYGREGLINFLTTNNHTSLSSAYAAEGRYPDQYLDYWYIGGVYYDSSQSKIFLVKEGTEQTTAELLETDFPAIYDGETYAECNAKGKLLLNNNVVVVSTSNHPLIEPGIYSCKWQESGSDNFIKSIISNVMNDVDRYKTISFIRLFGEDDTDAYVSFAQASDCGFNSWEKSGWNLVPILVIPSDGTYFGRCTVYQVNYKNPWLFTTKLTKQSVERLPQVNTSSLVVHMGGGHNWGVTSYETCDMPFDTIKEAFLNGVEVILYSTVTDVSYGSYNSETSINKIMAYKAVDYVPEIMATEAQDDKSPYLAHRAQIRFVAFDYNGYKDLGYIASEPGAGDVSEPYGTYAGRVELSSKVLCKVLSGEFNGFEFIKEEQTTEQNLRSGKTPIKKLTMNYWVNTAADNNNTSNIIGISTDSLGHKIYWDPRYDPSESNTDTRYEAIGQAANRADIMKLRAVSNGNSGVIKDIDISTRQTGYKYPVDIVKTNYKGVTLDSTPGSYLGNTEDLQKFNYLFGMDAEDFFEGEDIDAIGNDFRAISTMVPYDYLCRPRFNFLQTADISTLDGKSYQRIDTKSETYWPGVPYSVPYALNDKEKNIARFNLNLPYDSYESFISWSGNVDSLPYVSITEYADSIARYYKVSDTAYTPEQLNGKYRLNFKLEDINQLGYCNESFDSKRGVPILINTSDFTAIDDEYTGYKSTYILIITNSKSSGKPVGTYFYKLRELPSDNYGEKHGYYYEFVKNILTKVPTNKLPAEYIEGGGSSVPGIAQGTGANALVFNNITNNTAKGDYSIDEGNSSTKITAATLAKSDAEIIAEWETLGDNKFSLAKGNNSHSEGSNSLALGKNSHAEGNGTVASASAAHSEGTGSRATGKYSHAGGLETVASGYESFAHGYRVIATGEGATALGYNNSYFTDNYNAGGRGSLTSGVNTKAPGDGASAFGKDTYAPGAAQTVVGQYNEGVIESGTPAQDAAFIVGNGNSDSERANAFIVYKDGHTAINAKYYEIDTPLELNTKHNNCYIGLKSKNNTLGYYGILANGTPVVYQNGKGDQPIAFKDSSGNMELTGNLKAAGLTDGTTTKTMTEILAGGNVPTITISSSQAKSANEIELLDEQVAIIENDSNDTIYLDVSSLDLPAVFIRKCMNSNTGSVWTSPIDMNTGNYVVIDYNNHIQEIKPKYITLHSAPVVMQSMLAGDISTGGKITVGAGPTNNMDVATKQYVDGAISDAIAQVAPLVPTVSVQSAEPQNPKAGDIWFVTE